MATVEIRELIKPETGEKFYPYAHLNGVKGAELLPRIGGSVQTTLPTPIFQVKDALNAQFYPQTHAQAVIGLAQMIEDNQFFEKESDGNGGFRIKLKDGFTGLYADGWVASGGVGSGGSGGGGLIESVLGVADLDTPIVLEDLSETFSAKAIQTIWDAVKELQQSEPDLSAYATKAWVQAQGYVAQETDPTVPAWAKEQSKPSYSLSEISGTEDLRAIEALAGTAGLLKKTAENTWALDTNPYVYEVNTQGDGFLDFVHNDGNITRIDLNHEHSNYVPITRTVNGTPLSQDISITAQGLGVASWAMGSGSGSTIPAEVLPDLYALGTKVTDAPGLGILLGVSVMSANLATSAGEDTSRVQWDHINNAWHFYGNVYVDGFLASGGIGDGGGGGGYGVEEITSNEDGTVDFHFTGGDVTTVDLNHEHPQYPKYVVCTQAEYDALTTKDSDTLYLIPATV